MSIEEQYYVWLLSKISAEVDSNYSLLLSKLYTTMFKVKRDVDQLRARKVVELRNEFCDEWFINYPKTEDIPQVSILEVLVSLSLDAERTVMRDGSVGDRTSLWFCTMIRNLGLDIYSDGNYDRTAVELILERFVNHKYKRNGVGSVAYTTSSRGDFRKLDVWQQLNIWLTENYVCNAFIYGA